MWIEDLWIKSKFGGRNGGAGGVQDQLFQRKLKALKGKMKTWNKEEFGNIFMEKRKLEERMELIQQKIIWEGRIEALSKEEGSIIT